MMNFIQLKSTSSFISADRKSSSVAALIFSGAEILFVFNLKATSSGDRTLRSVDVFTTRVRESFAYSKSLSSERLDRLCCR